MPQNKNIPKQQQQKKKKKGRAPAHQNTFAFKHNPKSKKTAKILELPNQHVCRRCCDKIEWRKKYRKYKPRTQPGRCNLCYGRNVMAAYHTICEKCSLSDKAIQTVEQHNTAAAAASASVATVENENSNNNNNDHDSVMEMEQEEQPEAEMGQPTLPEQSEADSSNNNHQPKEHQKEQDGQQRRHRQRACAMCVKEFALPCSDDEIDDDLDLQLKSGSKRLTLRQRKTLERQKAAAAQQQRNNKKTNNTNNDPVSSADDEDSLSHDDDDDEGEITDMDTDGEEEEESEEEEENDPFLRAVGGKGKLLVGEAYQQSLLQKEMAYSKRT